MKNLFFIFLSLILYLPVFSSADNVSTDSLILTLDHAMDDTVKAIELADIAYELRYSDPVRSRIYAEKGLKLSKELNYPFGIGLANNVIGILQITQSVYDSALIQFEQNLKIFEGLGKDRYIARTFRNIGAIYFDQGYYDSALENLLKSLAFSERMNDSLDIAMTSNNIGNVYYSNKDFDKALAYFKSSYVILKSLKKNEYLLISLNNIGAIYNESNKTDSARAFFNKSLELSRAENDIFGIAHALNNIGLTYIRDSLFQPAIEYFEKSQAYAQELGAEKIIAINCEYLGISYLRTGRTTAGKNNLLHALEIGERTNQFEIIKEVAEILFEFYLEKDDFEEALKYFVQFKQASDSLLNQEIIERITQLEMQKEFDEKQREIQIQREKDELILKSEIRQQKLFRNFSVAGLILILIISLLIYKSYQNSQKANKVKEFLLKEIKVQKKALTDSIEYAQRIQRSILPIREEFDKEINNFILFKPKDIVSGDFYWFGKKNEKVLVAIADCTGHGVPGAFMSMLGIRFLNEISLEKGILQPDKILNLLRDKIIEALHQKGIEGENKDGMDISLCCIDKKKNTIQWAGAYNPLILIRDGKLIEYKADRMPIGIHEDIKPFKLHTLEYKNNDCVYMFSDGYSDQFGGAEGRKFMLKPFKKLLLEVSEFPIQNQSDILDIRFEEWKMQYDQIDDVSVMGIRF